MTGGAERLPSGRASRAAFSRADVAEHQRTRLLRAMAEVVGETGYVATTVSAVIGRAGVSRATFYQQFADKQDCFLAAYDYVVEVLLSRAGEVAAVHDDDRPGHGGLTFPRLLAGYLDAVVEHEPYARVFLLEGYAVGAEVIVRRAAGQRLFEGLLVSVLDARTDDQRFAVETLVAAIASMVTTRLAQGDLDGIRGLHAPLVGLAADLFGSRPHPSA